MPMNRSTLRGKNARSDETGSSPRGPEPLLQQAISSGAQDSLVISTGTIVVSSWVQWKCRYGCEDYGKRSTCPPYTPSWRETGRLLREYSRAILIRSDQSFRIRYLAYLLEREAYLLGYYKAFGMGAGPCGLCDTCDVRSPCRRPREARPAMEACGIDVYETVRRNGFHLSPLRDREDPQQSFGLVLLE